MSRDEDCDQLRAENQRLHEQVQDQEDELKRLRQSNEDLREGLRSAISSLQAYHKQVVGLEEVSTGLRRQVSTLQQRQAKDSHNSSLPPSSDRFVRAPKSLRQPSCKKPGGQKAIVGIFYGRSRRLMISLFIQFLLVCTVSTIYVLNKPPFQSDAR